ncbi:MAG: hypothetical protein IJY16_07385 [Clostridia bacterium]|nr:hypothetical protein [Clostridia bacterium]
MTKAASSPSFLPFWAKNSPSPLQKPLKKGWRTSRIAGKSVINQNLNVKLGFIELMNTPNKIAFSSGEGGAVGDG